MRSPKTLNGATTQSIMFFVDDADAHCANARAHGAQIIEEPATHDYGRGLLVGPQLRRASIPRGTCGG